MQPPSEYLTQSLLSLVTSLSMLYTVHVLFDVLYKLLACYCFLYLYPSFILMANLSDAVELDAALS